MFLCARDNYFGVIVAQRGEKFFFWWYIISRTILKTGTLRGFFAPEAFGMPLRGRSGRCGKMGFF